MDYIKHWIPACAGMTTGLDFGLCETVTGFLGGLFQTPPYHLGRLFQTRLYRLRPVGVHPCRRACAGMTTGAKRVFRYPDSPFAIPDKCLNPASTVIPAKAGIQEGGAGG